MQSDYKRVEPKAGLNTTLLYLSCTLEGANNEYGFVTFDVPTEFRVDIILNIIISDAMPVVDDYT